MQPLRSVRLRSVKPPPWASTIGRANTRPMPEPPGLVVKNGTNRLSDPAAPRASSITLMRIRPFASDHCTCTPPRCGNAASESVISIPLQGVGQNDQVADVQASAYLDLTHATTTQLRRNTQRAIAVRIESEPLRLSTRKLWRERDVAQLGFRNARFRHKIAGLFNARQVITSTDRCLTSAGCHANPY